MICRERGWLVDVTGAEKLMDEQRRRGKILAGKSALNDGIEGDSSFSGFYFFMLNLSLSSVGTGSSSPQVCSREEFKRTVQHGDESATREYSKS